MGTCLLSVENERFAVGDGEEGCVIALFLVDKGGGLPFYGV